jgi:hypothetical protein
MEISPSLSHTAGGSSVEKQTNMCDLRGVAALLRTDDPSRKRSLEPPVGLLGGAAAESPSYITNPSRLAQAGAPTDFELHGLPPSKRTRLLPMPPLVPSAVMASCEKEKDKIVYKSKLSKGDINGVESGANLAVLLLPPDADATQCKLHLNKPDGRMLSTDIKLIKSETFRSKSANYLGLDAEMWPTIDETGRYVVFFTIHSSAAGAFPFPVDQRRNSLEMCTCGRETCQALPPSALSLSCKAEKSYPEQRTCPHRIKSRVLNLIQGRDCKTKPRSDRPFTLSIEMFCPGPQMTSHAGEVTHGRITEMQIFSMDASEPAAFRLACKT